MGFESIKPVKPIEIEEDLIWEHRRKKQQSRMAEELIGGKISIDKARRIERMNSVVVTHRPTLEESYYSVEYLNPGSSAGSARRFENLADMIEWTRETGGVVYKRNEETKRLDKFVGETVDDILGRKAEMVEADKIRKAGQAEKK